MPATPPGPTVSPQTAQLGWSLLSKIRTPFASKIRNVAEFYIQPDDPHRQYSPGDAVTGSVVLKVMKPIRITHIVVCLHGYAQVYKGPNSPGEGFRTATGSSGTGKGKKLGGCFGNGYATLFEDEVVLCGEGRLGERTYRFDFILQFPRERLPSSIDFERGTITYLITSTMTRPTTISPTTTCEMKVYLAENIDVGCLHQPKPRIISLEPISRRSRTKARVKKRTATTETQSETPETGWSGPLHNSRVSELSVNQEDNEAPSSPAPSDVSFDSCVSSAGTGSVNESGPLSIRSSDSGLADLCNSSLKNRTITATIELQKAGFLRGDTIPLRILVNHTKHIKSLHGIIVTLYRQARVDMYPILPENPSSKSTHSSSDDYYPKSKTGLGGLSLSSAGSSHLFRKDLSQSFTSLIINPQTLNAEVKAAVRVPEEAFPTIASVPGGMISFKYYVEVVLDLQGKLAGLDRFVPNPGIVSVPTAYGNGPAMARPEDSRGGVFTAWGANFIDTQQIRRDKSVVACVFEVIIGTRDSGRVKGKEKAEAIQPSETSTPVPQSGKLNDTQSSWDTQPWQSPCVTDDDYHHSDHHYETGHDDIQYDYHYNQAPQVHSFGQSQIVYVFPPPTMKAEEGVSEKERLRRAEANLLPSSPPGAEGESSTITVSHAPSAPTMSDGVERHVRLRTLDPWFGGDGMADAGFIALADHNVDPAAGDESQHSSTPAYHSHGHSDGRLCAVTDDKQELHRRRLETERSAPSDLPLNEEGQCDSPAPHHDFSATAPALLEEDETYGTNEGLEQYHLPRYER